ncbi:hypothetical protein [Peristeroidobacter soli]|jgi:hypothetical protein|uniref:hypothetical protein n=1 Tax=Peristeroidobacter soli TaxID=2497877 RepID=UPI00101D97B2|nr:hypothetical protein [Peristeroidobacter soli]
MSKHCMTRGDARRLGALLEEFARERRYVPEDAQGIEALDELPLCLQARARKSDADSQWRAWTDGHRIWFVVAQRVRFPGEEAGEITLKLAFYDHDGVLAATGAWLRRATGQWVLYSVLDDQPVADDSGPGDACRQFSLAS